MGFEDEVEQPMPRPYRQSDGGSKRAEVEARVGCAVREHLADCSDSDDGDLIRSHVVRVEVHADQLAVELKAEASSDPPNAVDNERLVLRVPWKKTPMKRRREIIVPASVSSRDRRPIRAETRVTLRTATTPTHCANRYERYRARALSNI
jgi:hypothetical protein